MPQTKRYGVKGKRVIFRKSRHCIHSQIIRKKQSDPIRKYPESAHNRNTGCLATMCLRLERRCLTTSYPFEINISFKHNHVVHSTESLSFRRVHEEVCNKFIQMFHNGHSSASALYTYEDELHLLAVSNESLVETLANYAINLDYAYVLHLFEHYRNAQLGGQNGALMFQCLAKDVSKYNASGCGQAILQEYDLRIGKAFILCIVTELMKWVHEKIREAGKICYVDASASFEPLNTSITLLYTSCIAGTLPLGLFITSNELEITIEKAINFLKLILPEHAFFGRGCNIGPQNILTNDLAAEQNTLKLSWPQANLLLCTFCMLQAFWH